MTASEVDAEIDAQAWGRLAPRDASTDRLRRAEPYAPTLKNPAQPRPRRNLIDSAEHHLTTVVLIVAAACAALASTAGIVLAGFAFMVVVFGGLHIVTSTLNALPWELLALAVVVALLWRAQVHKPHDDSRRHR